MKPPAPGPVSGLSVTAAANAAATHASTALPPSASDARTGLRGQRMARGDGALHGREPSSPPRSRPVDGHPRRNDGRVSVEERRRLDSRAPADGGERRGAAVPPRPVAIDGDPDLAGEPVVDRRAEDDVRVVGRRRADHLGGLVDLEERQVVAAGDREQDAARAGDLGRRSAGCRARARPPRARGSRRSRSRCPSAPSRRPS